jgi:hypothetical protein
MTPTWKILSLDAGQSILVQGEALLTTKSVQAIAMVLMVRADIPLTDPRNENPRPANVKEDTVLPSIEIPERSGSKRKRGRNEQGGGRRAKGAVNVPPTWESLQEPSRSEPPVAPSPEPQVHSQCCFFQASLIWKTIEVLEEEIRTLVGQIFDTCFGCWAHHRIVCVGNRTNDKAPPALADMAEVDLQRVHLPEVREFTYFRTLLMRHIKTSKKGLESTLQDEISRIGNERYPRGVTWVLLDWTTLSFRRASSGFQSRLPTNFEANVAELGEDLGNLVLSHICWLEKGSNGAHMTLSEKWSGHRFSITTIKRFEEAFPDLGNWTDVSE